VSPLDAALDRLVNDDRAWGRLVNDILAVADTATPFDPDKVDQAREKLL